MKERLYRVLKKKKGNEVWRLLRTMEILHESPHLNIDQVEDLINRNIPDNLIPSAWGAETEKLAKEQFKLLPYVKSVQNVRDPFDPMKDFTITISQKGFEEYFGYPPAVYAYKVEVKSSLGYKIIERNQYGDNEDEIKENLAKLRLVLVNPRYKYWEHEVAAEIKRIDSYWREGEVSQGG